MTIYPISANIELVINCVSSYTEIAQKFAQTKMKMAKKNIYIYPLKKKGTAYIYERHCTAFYRVKFKKSLQLMSSSSFTY